MSPSKTTPPSPTALVYGATGVTGWGLCKNLLEQQADSASTPTFSRVIGVCKQPAQDLGLFLEDKRFELVDGVDLLQGEDSVVEVLKEVKGIENVTHVFYVANRNSPSDGPDERISFNVKMIQSAVKAAEQLSSNMQVLIMQTSINVYGIFASLMGGTLTCPSPLVESADRTPSPYREMDVHYAQCDELKRLSKGKSWSWFEVRPDAVIGYVPRRHENNFTVSLGLFLATYAHVHGAGAPVRFPGTPESWKCKFSMVSQDQLARFEIHLATHAEGLQSGEAFNVSNGDVLTWSKLWPEAAARFGLRGVGPEGAGEEEGKGEAEGGAKGATGWSWPLGDETTMKKWEEENQVQKGWGGNLSEVCFVNTMRPTVDRILSLDKAKKIGFEARDDTIAAFDKAWALFKKARILP
ncbi:hypothetical protein IAQ61_007455 [Plenodomus lingam]|uniref:Short chain dehydrogenase sirS n=2 Tax=Leptosphaeria maculans TaxID=5022 RepID=SIRS_LEPMC|nr:similar to NAD-dependent epimerase/dehydratase [Plenodomus lingam JN3]Q6Q878.1 RecName: Full=Short chain dehydrogenase sirS; AltName: Full=Sirodesmin biosynthesis protein S [Plenodomus lingam]AAS92550.1 SirS [Plenodomus lingam]KAH9866866.1 hypothetical protein IAQ61_007455 [Plenodomus lingam]CBX98937.1 similar to NAD-dependent epimerase/dehydratase [Plenodomus lingam JN3]